MFRWLDHLVTASGSIQYLWYIWPSVPTVKTSTRPAPHVAAAGAPFKAVEASFAWARAQGFANDIRLDPAVIPGLAPYPANGPGIDGDHEDVQPVNSPRHHRRSAAGVITKAPAGLRVGPGGGTGQPHFSGVAARGRQARPLGLRGRWRCRWSFSEFSPAFAAGLAHIEGRLFDD